MIRFSSLIDAFALAKGQPPHRLWPFVRWALAGAWPPIVVAALFGALTGVTEIASAFLIGWVIDDALAKGEIGYMAQNWHILGGVAVFYLILRPAIMGTSAAFNSLTIGPNLNALVLTRLHRHTLTQHIQFFDDDFAGRLAQKQMQTTRALTDTVVDVVMTVFFALTTLIGAGVLMASVDGWLALALALWLLGYFAAVGWFLPRIRILAKDRAAARARVTGQMVDTLTNMRTVKLFAHAGREEQAAHSVIANFRDKQLRFGRMAVGFRITLNLLAGTLPVMMIGGALWLWQSGFATAGQIATAGIISSRIGQMTGWVSFTALGIFSHVGEVEDGIRTLTPEPKVTDAPDATTPANIDGAIRFDDVHFRYGRKDGGGLNGLTFAVAPGEKVALVGASGAGKSTAVSLLLRLYDLEQGTITLDGTDIATFAQEGLREQISMVTQETAMFNRSARENILYGRPEASEAEMIDAATRAEAHDFILDLRDIHDRTGYDAHLGERGVKLSGGQRQRIALARAILKDAPILLLDEATSALDSEVEAEIQQALIEVMEGKTVIAIAHRLSTIARMDRILVMDEGRIVEEGTHDALLAKGGLYSRFWSRQSGGFLDVKAAE